MVKDESRPGEGGPGEDEAVVVDDEAEIQLGKRTSDAFEPDRDLPMAVRDGDDGDLQVGDAPAPEVDPDATRP